MLIQDITPAKDQLDRTIAKAHYQLIGYKDWRSKKIEVQEPLVVNKRSGCYFIGYNLKHTDSCTCNEEYDRWKWNRWVRSGKTARAE